MPGQALAQQAAAGATDDKEARELFQLGKQAFEEMRYERALKYFKDAYDLSHRPALLSNIGATLDRLRRDREALDAYRAYLAQVPDAFNRGQIEERIQLIEASMQPAPTPAMSASGAAQPATTPVAPSPTEVAQAQTARDAESDRAASAATTDSSSATKPVYKQWWFWTGIGTVAATAIIISVVAASGGGTVSDPPAVLGSGTRVRQL
jgi:tetratricopeptide (TPR) repeat protein